MDKKEKGVQIKNFIQKIQSKASEEKGTLPKNVGNEKYQIQ